MKIAYAAIALLNCGIYTQIWYDKLALILRAAATERCKLQLKFESGKGRKCSWFLIYFDCKREKVKIRTIQLTLNCSL